MRFDSRRTRGRAKLPSDFVSSIDSELKIYVESNLQVPLSLLRQIGGEGVLSVRGCPIRAWVISLKQDIPGKSFLEHREKIAYESTAKR